MPYATCQDGTKLFYEDRGEGQPVLFVHGWGMNADVWEASVASLGGQARCITVDMRGCGRSDKPLGPYPMELYAADAQSLLTELGLTDVAYVGWSMGGALGIFYMRCFGDRVSRLLLVGPASPRYTQAEGFPYGVTLEEFEGFLSALHFNRPQFLLDISRGCFHSEVPEATVQWFWNIFMQNSPQVDSNIADLARSDERESLSRISAPVTVVHGRHDQLVPFEVGQYLADHLPDGRLLEFEASGHAPFIDEQARFEEVLASFVKGG
jgi:pimeloyl-ACP methyl ester carboxylesterase